MREWLHCSGCGASEKDTNGFAIPELYGPDVLCRAWLYATGMTVDGPVDLNFCCPECLLAFKWAEHLNLPE